MHTCVPSIHHVGKVFDQTNYQGVHYSPGEANLFVGYTSRDSNPGLVGDPSRLFSFTGSSCSPVPRSMPTVRSFLRLEEIYTHLIGRFPTCCPLSEQVGLAPPLAPCPCTHVIGPFPLAVPTVGRSSYLYHSSNSRLSLLCPLSEQELAILRGLCEKLNKFFTDGKQIKQVLEQQPSASASPRQSCACMHACRQAGRQAGVRMRLCVRRTPQAAAPTRLFCPPPLSYPPTP